MIKLAEIKKLLAYILGVAAAVVDLGVINDPYRGYILTVLAVATGAGIYQAKNASPTTHPSVPKDGGYGLIEIGVFLLLMVVAVILLLRYLG